jgi:hypothetical protein
MCKLIVLPCVVLFSVVAAPVSAAPQIANQVAPSTSQQSATLSGGSAAAVADKKICKELPSSYTRMTERVCLTKRQWQQVHEEAERQ